MAGWLGTRKNLLPFSLQIEGRGSERSSIQDFQKTDSVISTSLLLLISKIQKLWQHLWSNIKRIENTMGPLNTQASQSIQVTWQENWSLWPHPLLIGEVRIVSSQLDHHLYFNISRTEKYSIAMCWDPVVISIPNDESGATVVSWWFFWLEEEDITKLTQKNTRLPHPWLPFYWKHKGLLYFTFNHICQAGSTTLILCIHSLSRWHSLCQGPRPLHPCLLKTGQGFSRQKLDLHIHSKGSFGSPRHHVPCCALKSFHFYWSQPHQRGPKGHQAHTSPHTSPFYLEVTAAPASRLQNVDTECVFYFEKKRELCSRKSNNGVK